MEHQKKDRSRLLYPLATPGRCAGLEGQDGAAPILVDRFKFKNLRRKAATDKAKATSIKEASEMLDYGDEATTRKHYIRDEAIKPNKVRPVRGKFWTRNDEEVGRDAEI